MPDDALSSLLAAVAAAPDDLPLRLHLAEELADRDRLPEALTHCTAALALLRARLAGTAAPAFDWVMAEDDVAGVPVPDEPERPAVRLDDVGGMAAAKAALESAFLGPVRHPELAREFGTTASGGLLLYGPPGCGKTFLARAVAGELGAGFLRVDDVLDARTGPGERTLAATFARARRAAPCVLFLEEIDVLGCRRSRLPFTGPLRATVDHLLTELDAPRDGVFVLAATNHPWDLDPAVRRPGRLDRMLLVLPPDAEARAAILRHHLRGRPGEVDVRRIAGLTEHFSGADLAHVVTTAAERALAASVRAGRVEPLTTRAVAAAAREARPSCGPWFATARNVVAFANTDGEYDDLAKHLRRHRRA